MKEIIKKIVGILLSRKKIKLVDKTDFFTLKMMQGELLSKQLSSLPVRRFSDAEFKVFSEWGDDGLIQFIRQHIDFENEIFVEFGVENYEEANTRFLLHRNNWEGLVMDGSPENIAHIRAQPYYYRFGLQARQAFITAENINQLIDNQYPGKNIGILHIDIDGNDWHVWKAINSIKPEVVITEYNAAFGPSRSISVPYRPDFNRTKAHHSNLFFGASLQAFRDLAGEKGYVFLGCNLAGNNAYFLRADKAPDWPLPLLVENEGYVRAKFREHRDENGSLTFRAAEEAVSELRGLPVLNTKSGVLESF